MLSTLDAVPRHDESPTVNCYRILFMTYWHKFQMIFNGRFVTFNVGRPRQDNCRVQCRHGVSLLLFRKRFPPLCFIHHLYLSVVARLMSVMCTDERHSLLCIMSRHAPYCWLATSLFWYSAPTRFLKRFWKNAYPTFKCQVHWECWFKIDKHIFFYKIIKKYNH